MPVADARDCSINYLEQGDGVHNVLFLHGLLQSSELWTPLMRGMPSIEFRRLAFDLPGCGGSSPLPTPTIDAMADSVRQALHSIKIERCSVVACGVGGMVAQSLGARYPHIVFKLVLFGSRAFALDAQAATAQAERLAELDWSREALSDEIASHYVKRPREKLFGELLDIAEATDQQAACAVAREYATCEHRRPSESIDRANSDHSGWQGCSPHRGRGRDPQVADPHLKDRVDRLRRRHGDD